MVLQRTAVGCALGGAALVLVVALGLGGDGLGADGTGSRSLSPSGVPLEPAIVISPDAVLPTSEERRKEQIVTARSGPGPESATVPAARTPSVVPGTNEARSWPLILLCGSLGALLLGSSFWVVRRRRSPLPFSVLAHARATGMVERRRREAGQERAPVPEAVRRVVREKGSVETSTPGLQPVSGSSDFDSLLRSVAPALGSRPTEGNGRSETSNQALGGIEPASSTVENQRLRRLEDSLLLLADTVKLLSDKLPEPDGTKLERASEVGPAGWIEPHPFPGFAAEGKTETEGSAVRSTEDDGVTAPPNGPESNGIADSVLTGGTVPEPAEAAGGTEISPWEHFLGHTRSGSGDVEDPEAPLESASGPGRSLATDLSVPGEGSPETPPSSVPELPPAAAPTSAVMWVRSRSSRSTGGRSPAPGEGIRSSNPELDDLVRVREHVLDLAGQGASPEEICAQVRIGRHEVDLILKTLFEERKAGIRAAEPGVVGR